MLAAVTVVLTTLGAWRTDLTGYGTKTQLAIGIGVMLIAVLLWIYRQRVEDVTTESHSESQRGPAAGHSQPR